MHNENFTLTAKYAKWHLLQDEWSKLVALLEAIPKGYWFTVIGHEYDLWGLGDGLTYHVEIHPNQPDEVEAHQSFTDWYTETLP